jgi:hypothetical protein
MAVITIWAMWYCYQKMNRYRVIVWRKQRYVDVHAIIDSLRTSFVVKEEEELVLMSRMALAAKGVSVDPVTGARRQSTIKEMTTIPTAEDDMRSPILVKHANDTYEDPYESKWVSVNPFKVING